MERRRPNQGRALTADKAAELLNGKIDRSLTDYDGYGVGSELTNVADFISEEMRLDWEANRELLLEVWRSGELFPHDVWPGWRLWLMVEHDGTSLPWCEKVFGGAPANRAPAATARRLRAR